jgi:hypothetical protein
LLDHVIVFNERHLRRLLNEYVAYYNADRVHTQLRDSPAGRSTEHRPSPNARVVGLPRVGGLHHRYVWREAAQGPLTLTRNAEQVRRTNFENAQAVLRAAVANVGAHARGVVAPTRRVGARRPT